MTTRLLYPFSLLPLFCLLITSSSAAEPSKPIGPRIKIEPLPLDFGIVEGTEPITRSTVVYNTGDQPLEARHECSCGQLLNPWSRTIPPGGSAELPMTFTPARLGPGDFQRSMMIYCNDPSTPKISVTATGFHRPLVYLSPPVIQFGTVLPGHEGTALLTIASRDKDVEVRSIETGHPLITFRNLDADMVVAPDPNFPGHQQWEFTLSKDAPTGSLSSTAIFVLLARHPDHPNDPPQKTELTASIIAHVLGDILTEPRFIRVAQAFPGETFSEKILISSATGQNFNITSCKIAESTLPGVTARTEPVVDGELKRHYLILEGTGADTPGMFRGYIELTTDIPNESPLRVQFNGFTREKPIPAQPR